jgi:hypothetical protein
MWSCAGRQVRWTVAPDVEGSRSGLASSMWHDERTRWLADDNISHGIEREMANDDRRMVAATTQRRSQGVR